MIALDDRKAAFAACTAASFLTPLMASSINLALPSISREFAMDALSLSWVATSFLLAAAMFLVPFGRLADIYGRKRIFVYGMILFTLFSFLCGFALSGSMLIALRALQGLGAAMIFATSMAILTSAYPAAERGKVLGFNVAAVYTGLSIGPFVGGMLTQFLGWRSIFYANAGIGLLVCILVLWKLKSE